MAASRSTRPTQPAPPERPNALRDYPLWQRWAGGILAVVLLGGCAYVLARGISSADVAAPAVSIDPPAPVPSQPPPPAAAPAVAVSAPEQAATVALPPVFTPLSRGDTGPDVAAFQQRLAQLSYLVGPVNGSFGSSTGYAVLAFQKVEGLPRTGVIDPATAAAMGTAGIPTATFSSPPDHLEVDIARQVLLVVQDGQVSATVEVSTGSGVKFTEKGSPGTHVAVTPNGVFSILWKYNGEWTSPLGKLYRPAFIDDRLGIAIHGFPSVPATPASHGCIRVPMAFQDILYTQDMPVGETVFVYGGPDGPNP